MEPRRASPSSPVRRAVTIAVVGIAATLVVAWLVGAFRSSVPVSGAVDTAPTASPASPAISPTAGRATASNAASPGAPVVSPGSVAPVAPDPVLIGAGDIARCDTHDDEATARLLKEHAGMVFTLGDNAYVSGSPAEFRNCYGPTWGRVLDRTAFAVPGNHDYATHGAAGYRAYFGDLATPHGSTWYSRDVGAWHVVVLDANCVEPGVGCGADSTQVRWLRADLAASGARCTLALWHQPRFSGGYHGDDPSVGPFWDALYEAGADLVLNGHDHDYERFAPQDPAGHPDPDRGITEIVAGTGGGEQRPFESRSPNSIARTDSTFGILEVTLGETGWRSRFIATKGSFADEAEGTCR